MQPSPSAAQIVGPFPWPENALMRNGSSGALTPQEAEQRANEARRAAPREVRSACVRRLGVPFRAAGTLRRRPRVASCCYAASRGWPCRERACRWPP